MEILFIYSTKAAVFKITGTLLVSASPRIMEVKMQIIFKCKRRKFFPYNLRIYLKPGSVNYSTPLRPFRRQKHRKNQRLGLGIPLDKLWVIYNKILIIPRDK